MAKPRVTGPCRLCGTVGELQDSHVLPRWAFRSVTEAQGGSAPIKFDGDTALYDVRQPSVRLLCTACEATFGTRENYVRRISAADGTFPALERATLILRRKPDEFLARLDPSLDVEPIGYFAASVLWRASVTDFFDTHLGLAETEFANYLLGRGPWPSGVTVVLSLLVWDQPAMEAVLIGPFRRNDGGPAYTFVVAGMKYEFWMGQPTPSGLALSSLRGQRTAVVTPDLELLRLLGEEARGSETKGKLAKRS